MPITEKELKNRIEGLVLKIDPKAIWEIKIQTDNKCLKHQKIKTIIIQRK